MLSVGLVNSSQNLLALVGNPKMSSKDNITKGSQAGNTANLKKL